MNADGYIKGVEAALTKKGLCSYYDGEELQVKGSNEQSEHFDIVLQSMHIRRGGTYESSCYPAAF